MLLIPTPIFVAALACADAAAPEARSISELEARFVEPSAAALAQQRGAHWDWEPQWVLALGVHGVDGDYDASPNTKEDPAFSADVVLYNWAADRGVGLELGLMYSSYDYNDDSLSKGSVDTYRVMAGLRIADRGEPSTIYIPYLRGGLMYRNDTSDSSQAGAPDDDGLGWYLGGGIDFRLGAGFAITPQLLFTNSSSLNSQEWVLGVLATFGF